MRRTYLTRSLAITALFWLYNYFTGSLKLMSYWYVLFGLLTSGVVNQHDYPRQIPEWFTAGIAPVVTVGAWLLINYPALFLLILVSIQVYVAGSFREAMEDFFDFLLQMDDIMISSGRRARSGRSGSRSTRASTSEDNNSAQGQGGAGGGGGGGGSIALVMDVTKTTLSPSHSLRPETENLTRLCTIKAPSEGFSSNSVVEADRVADSRAEAAIPAPPPAAAAPPPAAAAAAVVVVPAEENVVVASRPIVVVDNRPEAEEGEMSEDSDTDTQAPAPLNRPRSHYPTLPFHSRQAARDLLVNQYYDSDSTSDSDHGGRPSLSSRRGVRDMHISRKFSRNDRMSRFAEQQQAQASEENVASPPMHRSFSSAVDHPSSHDYAEGMRFKPERTSRPAKSPYPELPAVFRDRFMSPSAISSESRNKFMRSETVRSIAAAPVSRRG